MINNNNNNNNNYYYYYYYYYYYKSELGQRLVNNVSKVDSHSYAE